MNTNLNSSLSKRLLDDGQRELTHLYEIAETSGNWEQVAEFELRLVLDAVDRTHKARSK